MTAATPRELHIHWLGEVPYGPTLELQERLRDARVAGDVPDTLLLLEHRPVITFGRGSKDEHLLASAESLAQRGVERFDIGRGGDVTYHGPGQLVGYPIIDLRPDRQDVRRYVWMLEEMMIRAVGRYGLSAGRISGLNGTWIEDRKVGAVGVRLRKWVTMHGFALNVNTNLDAFSLIVPCGIPDKAVTSLAKERGAQVDMAETVEHVGNIAGEVLGQTTLWHDTPPEL